MQPTVQTAAAEPAMSWPQSISEFEALIEAMQHRLVQFAFCRLHSREDAEDVVQEVLVQAYRDREKHKSVVNAVPFLFRMVANRSTDLLRRRKLETGSPSTTAARAVAPDEAESAQRLHCIEQSLQRLPARQAEAIRLRVYADLSFEAAAQAMGCSVPTIKSRFRYGIQKLRRVLRPQGGEK